MLRSAYGYVREYIPLLLAFIVVFVAGWAWISFGPHTTTAKENWTKIESTWKPKRDADLAQIGASRNDFTAQLKAYTALRDDTKGWMDGIAGIKDWTDPTAASTLADDISTFSAAGSRQINLLDQLVQVRSASDFLAQAQNLTAAEDEFISDYQVIYADLYGGSVLPSLGPSMALPSGSIPPSPSPGASASPSASPATSESPSPGSSASPSQSPAAS